MSDRSIDSASIANLDTKDKRGTTLLRPPSQVGDDCNITESKKYRGEAVPSDNSTSNLNKDPYSNLYYFQGPTEIANLHIRDGSIFMLNETICRLEFGAEKHGLQWNKSEISLNQYIIDNSDQGNRNFYDLDGNTRAPYFNLGNGSIYNFSSAPKACSHNLLDRGQLILLILKDSQIILTQVTSYANNSSELKKVLDLTPRAVELILNPLKAIKRKSIEDNDSDCYQETVKPKIIDVDTCSWSDSIIYKGRCLSIFVIGSSIGSILVFGLYGSNLFPITVLDDKFSILKSPVTRLAFSEWFEIDGLVYCYLAVAHSIDCLSIFKITIRNVDSSLIDHDEVRYSYCPIVEEIELIFSITEFGLPTSMTWFKDFNNKLRLTIAKPNSIWLVHFKIDEPPKMIELVENTLLPVVGLCYLDFGSQLHYITIDGQYSLIYMRECNENQFDIQLFTKNNLIKPYLTLIQHKLLQNAPAQDHEGEENDIESTNELSRYLSIYGMVSSINGCFVFILFSHEKVGLNYTTTKDSKSIGCFIEVHDLVDRIKNMVENVDDEEEENSLRLSHLKYQLSRMNQNKIVSPIFMISDLLKLNIVQPISSLANELLNHQPQFDSSQLFSAQRYYQIINCIHLIAPNLIQLDKTSQRLNEWICFSLHILKLISDINDFENKLSISKLIEDSTSSNQLNSDTYLKTKALTIQAIRYNLALIKEYPSSQLIVSQLVIELNRYTTPESNLLHLIPCPICCYKSPSNESTDPIPFEPGYFRCPNHFALIQCQLCFYPITSRQIMRCKLCHRQVLKNILTTTKIDSFFHLCWFCGTELTS